ncbi:MAG: DUF2062 domain-containing protein [Desulfobulbaceae bacterium]|nr:DUF2062 domain-containing protein [Desulfobulbaceae bacterium]
MSALAGLGWDTIVVMVLGGCVLAFPFALLSYILSLRFFSMVRKRRKKRDLNS